MEQTGNSAHCWRQEKLYSPEESELYLLSFLAPIKKKIRALNFGDWQKIKRQFKNLCRVFYKCYPSGKSYAHVCINFIVLDWIFEACVCCQCLCFLGTRMSKSLTVHSATWSGSLYISVPKSMDIHCLLAGGVPGSCNDFVFIAMVSIRASITIWTIYNILILLFFSYDCSISKWTNIWFPTK